MTNKIIRCGILPLSLLTACSAMGQTAVNDAAIAPVPLEPMGTPSLNRVSMGFQLGFNLNARFKHIGGFGAQSNPGSTNSASDHFYDDGYNRVDVTGNDHEPGFNHTTWFWGYQNDSQYDADANTIAMHSLSSPGANTQDRDNDPPPGLELTYSRELFRNQDDHWRVGMDIAFGYTDLEIKDSRPASALVNRLTDTYQVPDGFFPPTAPYSGSFDGPGAVISDTPTRSFDTTTLPVTGTRKFGADLFAFKLGPYFEIPLNETFSVSLNGGLAVVYIHSDFRFNEVVATPSGPLAVSGHGADNGVQVGCYLGGRINAALNDQWSLFAGANWQDVGSYVHKNPATGQSAVLDLTQAIFFSAGVGYSF